ncbi:RNA polymerase subunit sigma-24 [Arenicella chitinivorans]|uniref:RNA polymerase subunit sigma-24 n=1 Tax=Arenicella chitinivorans TaxID=1329800 RepID=A0A918VKF7_9GAMM|nr:RNA polymerase subunit sigma-24 [Arenicella chitinivorans]
MARLYRAKSGRILAYLVAQCGDIQLAEDALQDAFIKATTDWSVGTLPDTPEAWLITTAKRNLVDVWRQQQRHQTLQQQFAIDSLDSATSDEAQQEIPDERLKLIFTCCHPALNRAAQVALTLKTLCGLNPREIARAYLVSETAMQQRLVRAKQKIRAAGIAYAVPSGEDLPTRLASVLAVIYLIYNESHTAFEGQTLSRTDLANEALRLAHLVCQLLPHPEANGLLALMTLHQARQQARQSAKGAYVPLAEQDRQQWDQTQIAKGRTRLIGALSQGNPGPYQLEAAISAVHCEADSWHTTDWHQIVRLYQRLYELVPSPVVKLNELVAAAQIVPVNDILKQLVQLESALEDYQPFHAARADLSARAGQPEQARRDYQNAIRLSRNQVEKAYLQLKLTQL